MKVSKSIYKITLALIVLLNAAIYIRSQESDRISLSIDDISKLEKAESIFQKGTLQMQEAESFMAESGQMTDQGAIDKKNKQAVSKQADAAENYKKANQIKYEVYTSKISDFNFYFKGSQEEIGYAKILETQAKSDYASAQGQRTDSEGESDYLIKFAKVNSVIQTENSSIENLKKAFELYTLIPYKGSSTPQAQETSATSTDNLTDLASLTTLDTSTVATSASSTLQSTSYATPTTYDTVSYTSPVSYETIPSATEPTASYVPDTSYTQAQVQPESISQTPLQTQEVTNIYQAIPVNEKSVDQFNKFLTETYPNDYEKFVIDYSNLDYSNLESIKNAWYTYQYGEEAAVLMTDSVKPQQVVAVDTAQQASPTENIAQISTTEPTAEASVVLTPTPETIAQVPVETPASETNTQSKKKQKKQKTPKAEPSAEYTQSSEHTQTYTSNKREFESVPGFTFQIQIVACRVPMISETLQGIYSGPEQPVETLEHGWYKYSIGSFDTYASARDICDQINVPGAFVVAFLNGKKINVSKALVSSNADEYSSSSSVQNTSQATHDLVFRIQIAASESNIDDNELKKIYNGSENIEVVEEDGWYKYTINCGSSYKLASKLLNDLAIPGAFITVYHFGQKISIKDALKLKNKL